MTPDGTEFLIKLAEAPEELRAAQRLRYRVFVEELGGKTDPASAILGLERDQFDAYFDHLILQDKTLPAGDDVIAVYRLLRGEVAAETAGFYAASEFQLAKIATCGRRVLELGRSCVDARYRNGLAMHYMWSGLADYVCAHDIEILFGAASFQGTDPAAIAHALTYLHHNHLAPSDLRVAATGPDAVPLNQLSVKDMDRRKAVLQIPPLIKSYLRLGGKVGAGAYIDHAFNTIDVCLVMDTARMSQKHKAFYTKDSAA